MTNCTCHPGHTCTSVESCAAARRAEFGDVADYKAIREALAAVPLPHDWKVCQEPANEYWFAGRTIGAADPADARRVADTCALSPHAEKFAAYIAACNPSAIRALLADLDAMRADAQRYRLLRRGQHWSVVDGVGDILRADELDAAIDATLKGAAHE